MSKTNKNKLSISCKLQLFGIYIPLARLYIYIICIYKNQIIFLNYACIYIYISHYPTYMYVYYTSSTLKFVEKISLIFLIFSKNYFRNELHTPFSPYFYTQHLLCKNFHFVRRGSQNSKKNFKQLFQLGFVKRFFD